MSSENQRKASLIDFIHYFRKHIYELADNRTGDFTPDERNKIYSLGYVVKTLMGFSKEFGDYELYDIMDDCTYALQESSMGSPSKGKFELDKFAHRLSNYEKDLSEN